MSKYINSSVAIRDICEWATNLNNPKMLVREDVIGILESIPTADVRPVVLCRDCLHYEMGVCLKIYDDGAANKDAWQERKPYDYCSYGEDRADMRPTSMSGANGGKLMYDELVKRLRTARVVVFKTEDVMLLGEAADAIEELQENNAALNGTVSNLIEQIAELSKPRWIPVAERLPSEDGFTLIFTAHGHVGVCYFTNGWWGGYGEDGVTHWMPLTEPPKEKG